MAPSPGCRAAACRNLQSGAGGAGPVSMETASPGAGRSGADRAQSMDQCKPRSAPDQTAPGSGSFSLPAEGVGELGCAPALARDEGCATQVCTHTSTRRQRELRVSGRLGWTGSHGHSGTPARRSPTCGTQPHGTSKNQEGLPLRAEGHPAKS